MRVCVCVFACVCVSVCLCSCLCVHVHVHVHVYVSCVLCVRFRTAVLQNIGISEDDVPPVTGPPFKLSDAIFLAGLWPPSCPPLRLLSLRSPSPAPRFSSKTLLRSKTVYGRIKKV